MSMSVTVSDACGYFNQVVTDPATAEAILARLDEEGG
jgi:hypothetical protein